MVRRSMERKLDRAIILLATILVLLYLKNTIQLRRTKNENELVRRPQFKVKAALKKSSRHHKICDHWNGAEDLMVSLKTGATEIQQKLPIHFDTTLRCIPHYAIFSDVDDVVDGHAVHDILKNVSRKTMNRNNEFVFYQEQLRLHDRGSDLQQLLHAGEPNYAWNLDKWKFLPMVDRAYRIRPEAKWFVFVEADTAIVWSNLLQWLAKLDPQKPLYIGSPSLVRNIPFAHGGSGFVISSKAVRRLVERRTENIEEYDSITAEEWAGDFVLSRALKTVGTNLTYAWPIFQGETPYTLNFKANLWCSPVVSYHHMSPAWIERVWAFEQDWISKKKNNGTLRHRDTFEHFIRPFIGNTRSGWDNLSPNKASRHVDNASECEETCRQDKDCFQYSYSPDSCKTFGEVRLGKRTDPIDRRVVSGWLLGRIDAWADSRQVCQQDWMIPSSQ